MKFKIRNHLRVKAADIVVDSITVLAGKHMAGKSSILGAVTAIMTGTPNPYPGLLKKQISKLVHGGSPSGFVEMEDTEETSARIEWPECTYSASANHKTITSNCAGVSSMVAWTPAQRVKYIADVLKAAPTDIELISELKKSKVFPNDSTVGTEPRFIKLWDSIKINGWDVTFDIVKKNGSKSEGQWQLISGDGKYGIRKGEAYEPANFTPDLKNVDFAKLEHAKNQAQEWCDAASKDLAVSENELKNMQTKVDEIPRLKETLGIEQDKLAAYLLARKALDDDRKSTENRGLICPACRARLTLSNNELKTRPVDSVDIDIKAVNEKITANDKNIGVSQQQIGKINGLLSVAKDYETQIKEYDPTKKTSDNLEEVSEKLAIAIDRIDAYTKYHESKKLHKKIQANKKVSEILAPSGLRLKCLKKSIAKLNKTLKKLCNIAEWATVEFTDDCNIMSGGVPYGKPFLSRSERYRVRFLMQLIVAMAERSKFVILDDVDTLMKTQRGQMLKILKFEGFKDYKFIMGVAYDNNDNLPDFSKFVPGGKTYWIEEGKVL